MSGILASFSLLGYALLFRRLSRWPMEAMPLLVTSMVLVLNYVFAYVGILKPASTVMLLLGMFSLLLAPFFLPKKTNALLVDYFTPGFSLFVFFIILFGLIAQTLVVFTGWDEIARWLPMAKLTYLQNGINLQNYPDIQSEYPPGGALFYYYFLLFSSYSEGIVAYAQLFLVLAPLTILLKKYVWATWHNAAIFFISILLLLIFIFGVKLGPTGTIYMDNVAGLFFGGILAAYFLMTAERCLWAYLLLPSMALALFKPMLLPFLMIIAAVIVCDQLSLEQARRKKIVNVLLLSGVMVAPLLLLKSWSYYLHHVTDVATSWHPKQMLLAILHRDTSLTTAQYHQVLQHYVHALWQPALFLLLMLVAVASIYKYATSENKKRLLLSQAILLGGYLAYLALLLLTYLYMMTPYIAIKLNSFDRFMTIYYLGWFVVVIAHAVAFTNIQTFAVSKKIAWWIFYALIVFLCIYTFIYQYNHQVTNFVSKRNKDYLRVHMQAMAEPVSALTAANSKIGIIWKYDADNINPNLLGYELLPRQFVTLPETLDKTAFAMKVKALDYVLVTYVPEEFWQTHQNYFVNGKGEILKTGTFCISGNVLKMIESFGKIKSTPCTLHQVPFYLYKVKNYNNKLSLLNILATQTK